MSSEDSSDELIARFLGWKQAGGDQLNGPLYRYGKMNWEVMYVDDMRFSKSWDALMPVLNKIYSMVDPIKKKNPLSLLLNIPTLRVMDWKKGICIDQVYTDVVNFIKWYNDYVKGENMV
jgi:hypothetical protein